jgi:hypothetical protein
METYISSSVSIGDILNQALWRKFTLAISVYSYGFKIVAPQLIHTYITTRKRGLWVCLIMYVTKLSSANVETAIQTAVIPYWCPSLQFSVPVLICYQWSVLLYNTHNTLYSVTKSPCEFHEGTWGEERHYSCLASGARTQIFISRRGWGGLPRGYI